MPGYRIPWYSGYISHFQRPTAPVVIPGPPRSPEHEEFIPPMDSDEEEPETQSISISMADMLHTIPAYRYRTNRKRWKHLPMYTEDLIQDMMEEEEKKYPTTVRIITWNVDFCTPNVKERLYTALRHIEREVLSCKEGDAPFDPCCILLQEVHAEVFPYLFEDEWVRRHFIITPGSPSKWPENAHYGNVTLVSKLLTVVKTQILHFGLSDMLRTALAVYVLLSEPEPSGEIVMICVVNTHLESLPNGITQRPSQMLMASKFLKQTEVRGGVLAGDMNSIGPEDHNLHLEAQLRDAWRKGDKEESGFTWGYQEQDPGRLPPGRLDKILYLPRRGYKLDPPERIGIGLKTERGDWVSDHYGLDSTLRLVARRNSR
ncbi:hypothetical protein FA15DRAFT_584794 [Coprinopsis marcescibilis]|uniref:Endonuclease/exonuclease/phosphatase domain-containing protein n=1 Tax=Coprinopsis marcescibilis TaxID=230819 RepID=A0A5C3L7U9_COPMA|nr:hypothetical protein FA15DRAFT_584794 [Coprinopsis marcescibilis]